MYPEVLREQVRKLKSTTQAPFAVNLPLLYPAIDDHLAIIEEEGVPIVFTSAGNPAKYTAQLKAAGKTVVHVVSNVKFAIKARDAGVDAIVAEGFEAGGHNGREETTTLCLIPMVRDAVDIPLIAAGGIADGRAMLAAFALGAEGVQVGSRFVASTESSAHPAFKQTVVQAGEGATVLTLKQLTPVRLIRNAFYEKIQEAEAAGASPETLAHLLGRGRAKKGMFEGDLQEGELEIGQISAAIRDIRPAAEILDQMWQEFLQARERIGNLTF